MIDFKLLLRTPLTAAFFCSVFLFGCSPSPEPTALTCDGDVTAISSVQGAADISPLLDRQVTVRGVVTLAVPNEGFFIEQADSDNSAKTSNALFVHAQATPDYVTKGAVLTVRGRVTESGKGRDTLTSLTNISESIACGSSSALPSTTAALPLDRAEREALEAMRISLNGSLSVTDVYRFGNGHITLSGNGLQYVPTEVTSPGRMARDMNSSNRNHTFPVSLPANYHQADTMMAGMSVEQVTGVVAHDQRGQRIALESLTSESPGPFGLAKKKAEGSIRVVGMNLYNYFNGDGDGGGFPNPRGAETLEAFQHQRARVGAAIRVLDPDVLAVQELENDGFGGNSAARDLARLASGATNAYWQIARPESDDTGSDRIRVGILYREDRLKAIGPAYTLTGDEFLKSRQPQAQLLERLDSGERLLVVVNHLKSKGSCPEGGKDANQKDGQACWNPTRVASAKKMTAWAKDVAAKAGTDNILILGDMNAYRFEDPIEAIRQAGFTELMETGERSGNPVFSFAFFGQHGTLDYAFASDAMLGEVRQAMIWNVNSLMPANMPLPRPWLRFSDHDPVVVDVF